MPTLRNYEKVLVVCNRFYRCNSCTDRLRIGLADTFYEGEPMIFKIENLKTEFDSEKVSSYLKACLMFLDNGFKRVYGRELHITNILRSVNTQLTLCENYHVKSDFQHCLGEALDISVIGIIPEQINGLIDLARFELGKICQLALHQKGTAPHLHLNLVKDFKDNAKIVKLKSNPNVEKNYA